MNCLVSIIIPCYNAEKWIGECIDSALAQTYKPVEVIVIDDGSTDDSLSIVKGYGTKIKWVSQKNAGQSAARNKGVQLSRSEYIQFIDADDYISLTKIEEQIKFLVASNVDIVYSNWCYQQHKLDGSIELSNITINYHDEDILYEIIANNKILHGSCLYKRKIFDKILGFDESLRIAEDYDFSVRLALAGAKFSCQPSHHYFYRIYDATTASHGMITLNYPNSVQIVLDRIVTNLKERNLLSDKYRFALAYNYFLVAKQYLTLGELAGANCCHKKCQTLSESQKFRPTKNDKFEIIYRLFGWEITAILLYIQQLASRWIQHFCKPFTQRKIINELRY